MDFDTPVNQFIADVGDLPVTRITPVHARAFKDSLIATGQAPSTVKGKLSKLKQVVGYAVGNALITENPIENIRVEGSKKDVRSRRSWSTGDLQKLLDGPVHKEGKRPKAGKGEAAFWLPLLGLFSGARLEDIAQLRIEDVGEESGIAYFDFNDSRGKQVKNDFTPRNTPIHKTLIDLGFLGHVEQLREQGEERVFPGVETYRGQVAKAWSQWFGNYKRRILEIDPKEVRVDFHSFRHSFKTAARDSFIPADVRDRLQGHKPATVGEGYGESEGLIALKKHLDKLVYKGLDLSGLAVRD